jgi:hypothetical protein
MQLKQVLKGKFIAVNVCIKKPFTVVYVCNPSTQAAEKEDLKFEANYIASSDSTGAQKETLS